MPCIMSNRDTKGGDRDVFNEKPTREEQTVAMAAAPAPAAATGQTAVIHTTMGDIVSHCQGCYVHRNGTLWS